jgi:putative addiction module component (TIGR02574 family)
MFRMKRNYLAELLALPSKERAAIAIQLWESVVADQSALELSQEWVAEIQRRIEHIRANPMDASPWEEALERVESQLQAMREG